MLKSHRSSTDFDFEVEPQVKKRQPRAWEREPRSPHAPHQKGRKVWKRPDIRSNLQNDPISNPKEVVARPALGDLSANTPRAVKKLRLKDGREDSGTEEAKPSLYLTTLRDGMQGTPRSRLCYQTVMFMLLTLQTTGKRVQSQSLGSLCQQTTETFEQRSTRVSEEAGEVANSPSDAEVSSHVAPTDTSEALGLGDPLGTDTVVVTNLIVGANKSEEPKRSPNVPRVSLPEHPQPDNDEAVVREDESEAEENLSPIEQERSVPESQENLGLSVSALENPNIPCEGSDLTITGCQQDTHEHSQVAEEKDLLLAPPTLYTNPETMDTPKRVSGEASVKVVIPYSVATPEQRTSGGQNQPAPHLPGLETPQIGTTLLRRESLRRRESPSKKMSARKDPSPHKKQLKKRDTLQEREILQNFTEGLGADHEDKAEIAADEVASCTSTSSASDTLPPERSDHGDDDVGESVKSVDEAVLTGEAILDSKDVQRAVEAIEVCEEAKQGVTPEPTPEHHQDSDALQDANEAVARAEVNEAEETLATMCEKAELPVRQTRSGARFSDDTSMLKDFLNRAQARKAAKAPLLSPKVPRSLQTPPKRSPRKRSGAPERTSPPQSLNSAGGRPGTPPRKLRNELATTDDNEEEQAVEPASCRRSTRARIPAPPKTAPGAPSFIPVRRADGTDPVVLQKTQAQELAMKTRQNTRHNRGKPALQLLQSLPIEEADTVRVTRPGVAKSKAVAWAEDLTSFQDFKEAAEEAEDQRPKVKRMRGLGPLNGTPTAKRAASVGTSSNGTPAPKRRGKQHV